MKRVIHFLLDARPGGHHAYVNVLKAAPGMPPATVVTVGRGPDTDIALAWLRHRWRPLFALELILNLLQICVLRLTGRLGERGTVFHIHGAANLAPLAAARLLDVPAVWHLHESNGSLRTLARAGNRLAEGVFPVAAVTRRAEDAFGIRDATLVPSPVDTGVWAQAAPRSSNGIPTLLAVGNVNPLKGHDILMDAMSRIPGPWRLRIAGAKLATQAGYVRRVEKMAERIASEPDGRHVQWLGWQGTERVRELLEGCDLFVLPSRSEGSPVALLEAMSMGCVCVAAEVGEVGAMIDHGVSGWRVRPEDPEALATALRATLAMTGAERGRMGAAAREYVLNHHTPGAIGARVARLYATALAGRAHS